MAERISLKREEGAATVVENIIVLPVVFAVIMFIIYYGQLQYQKTLLMSAAERSLMYIEQAAIDYNYEKIAPIDLKNGASEIKNINADALTNSVDRQPYRYVASIFKGGDYDNIEAYVKEYIEKKQVFFHEDISVKIEESTGLYKTIKVKVSQSLPVPEVLRLMGISGAFDYTYETTSYVSQPTELIRNVDFVMELLDPYINQLKSKVKEIKDKINKMFNKISFLNGMNGQQ